MAVPAKDRVKFRRALLRWYQANRRDLPWRRTRDPYPIWISEIMLQQTRVAVVIERYRRFLKQFSSVHALARASETAILAQWSGLGYYRRARNLHAAAKLIVRGGGEFPPSSTALRTLPGIGRYTAAAIASIAFGEPTAVVDGNVERVLSRIAGRRLAGERMWSAAQEFLDKQQPGDFNQAMMELGATVCLPKQPHCAQCPVRTFCRTRGVGFGSRRKARQKREIGYLLARKRNSVLLVRRSVAHRLMPGMWELPKARVTPAERKRILFSLNHSITVTNFKVQVVDKGNGSSMRSASSGRAQWITTARLPTLPLTGLAGKILRRAGAI